LPEVGQANGFPSHHSVTNGRDDFDSRLTTAVDPLRPFASGFINWGRHQAHRVPEALERMTPAMSTRTGFYAIQARRQVHEAPSQLLTPQVPAKHDLPVRSDTMHLKNVPRQINTHSCSIHGGRPVLAKWSITLPLWHVDAVFGWGLHPIGFWKTAAPSDSDAGKPSPGHRSY
jgi:hypothetical protein